jgi:hypothetical protein
MLLIDWLSANIMMIFVVLILVGIPVAIGLTVFTKKKDSEGEEM